MSARGTSSARPRRRTTAASARRTGAPRRSRPPAGAPPPTPSEHLGAEMTEYDFPVAGTVRVQAAIRSSDLVLTAADVDRVAVRVDPTRSDPDGQLLAEQTLVEISGNVLRLEVPPSRSKLFGSSARLR